MLVHPSPLVVLPSSQVSPNWMILLPHNQGILISAIQPNGSKIYPVAVSVVELSISVVSKLLM